MIKAKNGQKQKGAKMMNKENYWNIDGNFWSKSKYSEAQARKLAETLKFCKNCINCNNCYGCYDCYECQNCENSYNCEFCKGCDNCYKCKYCADCIECNTCTNLNFYEYMFDLHRIDKE